MALKLKLADAIHDVTILARRPHLVVSVDGRPYTITNSGNLADGSGVLGIDGADIAFDRIISGGKALVRLAGRTSTIHVVDPLDEAEGAGAGRDDILAPMPGAVVQVHRGAGDQVMRGDAVLTIESMKLQTTLVAPRDGELIAMLKGDGDTFEKDEVVARLAPIAGGQ